MIDLDKGKEKLDKVDGFLTTLKTTLKKHWGFLILLLIGYFVYLFFVLVGEEIKNPTTQEELYHEYQDFGQQQHEELYYDEEVYRGKR